MSFGFRVLPACIAVAVLLITPDGAFADRKDGEKQRRENWEQRNRGREYGYGREGWGESEKAWRKEQKERDKDRRKAWKEREKDRREAAREWEKDQREAEREWNKERREAARDARRNGRDRDYRYRQPNRLPYPIP